MTGVDLALLLGKVVFAFAYILLLLPALIWAERKGAAVIQDRPGPNRAHILGIRALGMVHTLADVGKLLTKEDLVPSHVDRRWWAAAPLIGMTVSLVVFAVIPWADPITFGDRTIPMQVAALDGGALFVLAITSLSVYGTMLAGWSSNNKFAMLGGLRASAQMISYELAMGLAISSVFLTAGSLDVADIVAGQAGPPWRWGVAEGLGFLGIPAFLLFFVAVFAETNRVPFDLPEGEAELVAGFHTEYSALRFALFFMGEYAAMIGASALTTSLFFGGYQVPFVTGADLRTHADLVVTILGAGVIGFALLSLAITARRRGSRFRRALPPGDPRLRENTFWLLAWTGLALAGAGVLAAGMGRVTGLHPLLPEAVASVVHLGSFTIKTLFGCWCYIWVRWTLPRFRYDQLMDLGWRRLLPVSFVLVFATALWVLLEGAK